MASNNPVSGAGNKEVNSKIAFSSSICIILHIIFTSFTRNNTNATLYNNLVGRWYIIIFCPSQCIPICAILWTRSRRDPMCTNRVSFSALRSFAQNPVLVIFTFETFSVKKELELSRKRTQKMRISEAQKYQLVESLIVVLFPVGNVDKAQDIT